MDAEYINITAENLAEEHLCCIIRSKKPHPGVEAKKQWLAQRLKEGHVFRKLHVPGTVFIEYAPLQNAWVPIVGENYMYIYCLWVAGEYRGKGYARSLMDYCIRDAKAQGKSGICMLGAQKQKAWLSNQAFAEKYGFRAVDTTDSGYVLLALSFDGTVPAFTAAAKAGVIENKELTVYYDRQCPFIYQHVATLKAYCAAQHIPASFILVETLQDAKALPCVFNNWALFYNGRFETVNLLDTAHVEKIIRG